MLRPRWFLLVSFGSALAVGLMVWPAASAPEHDKPTAVADGQGQAKATEKQKEKEKRSVVVSSRSQMSERYPCTQCHYVVTPKAAQGAVPPPHDTMELDHMPSSRRCDLCHRYPDMDWFALIDGTAVSFDDSHRLCGQCHSTKERDWARGVHTKLVGRWDTPERNRLTCVECHDPHSPRRPPMTTVQTPLKPRFLIEKTNGHHGAGAP